MLTSLWAAVCVSRATHTSHVGGAKGCKGIIIWSLADHVLQEDPHVCENGDVQLVTGTGRVTTQEKKKKTKSSYSDELFLSAVGLSFCFVIMTLIYIGIAR